MVAGVVRTLFLPRQMARCGRTLFDRAQGPDVLADGWNCRGSDNFSTEKLGGVRNWDYRFCWVRDATLTCNLMVNAGYLEEAQEWREWLLRRGRRKSLRLNIVYGFAVSAG